MIELSIVTVTMNHLNQVKKLLDSVYNTCTPKISFEVVVVDNCSTDGTREYISRTYPDVKLIKNKEIYGFAKNNNIGVRASRGKLIAIINPDIILLPKSLDILCDELLKSKRIGVVCPMLLNSDMSRQASVRKFITPQYFLYRFLTSGDDSTKNKRVRSYLLLDDEIENTQRIDWAIGAAFLIRKKTYEELDGFDEKFFLYVEDVDLFRRLRNKKKLVLIVPDAKMIHAHNRSSSKGLTKARWYHLKSIAYYFWKHPFG